MNEYTSDIQKMIFSFSRCHSFENCRYEWYLNYLLRDEEGNRIYENKQNFYAAFGKYCHDILEKHLSGQLNAEDLVMFYQEHYDKNIESSEISESTADKYYYMGIDYFESIDFSWLEQYEILGIEKKCSFNIEGIGFMGYIDLLIQEKGTGNIIVIDHKSAEYPLGKRGSVLKRKQNDYENYKRQLYLYSQHVINEYGKAPTELWWNYFRDERWLKLPFIEKEFKEARKWALGVVKKVGEEEDFLPHMDYFYCKNLCGFRDTCDYKLMGGE